MSEHWVGNVLDNYYIDNFESLQNLVNVNDDNSNMNPDVVLELVASAYAFEITEDGLFETKDFGAQ